jgi:Flp pilus assembly protein TadG
MIPVPKWFRNRFVWVALILLAVSAGAVALARPAAAPVDLAAQLTTRMRSTLEQVDPGQHNHGGHAAAATTSAKPAVICGVRVYGYEPAEVKALADVRTVYGFHLCGVAEPKRPWDVAVKLAGPVILDMSSDPPGIQVVEATADVMFIDRLRQMFPPKYAELAQKEALAEAEMSDLRDRYDKAAELP